MHVHSIEVTRASVHQFSPTTPTIISFELKSTACSHAFKK